MADIDMDKERADLARFGGLRDAGTDAAGAYALMQAEELAKIAALRLLRGVYGLTLEQARDVTGDGTPFKTPEDTRRFLKDELGYCDCAGDAPVGFLRDLLRLLDARLKAAGGDPARFHALTDEFIGHVGLAGGRAAGGGPWVVMFLQHRGLLSHSRNLGDCHLTRRGEYLLAALDTLGADESSC